MAEQKRETKLWKHLKESLKDIRFTRIESRTINGIPDLYGVYKGKSFWMELKADYVSYPKLSKWQLSWINLHVKDGVPVLICNIALSQRVLKLYRILAWVEKPQDLVPDAVFPMHGQWDKVAQKVYEMISDKYTVIGTTAHEPR